MAHAVAQVDPYREGWGWEALGHRPLRWRLFADGIEVASSTPEEVGRAVAAPSPVENDFGIHQAREPARLW